MMLELFVCLRLNRQQLTYCRPLGHGIDKIVVSEKQAIEPSGIIGVKHDLDHADQFSNLRCIPQMGGLRNDVALEPCKECTGLGADGAQIDAYALVMPVLHIADNQLEHIIVQATA